MVQEEEGFRAAPLVRSEASLEARDLQLVDGLLVGEGGSGDAAGRTSFFTQPHLPVEDEDREDGEFTSSLG